MEELASRLGPGEARAAVVVLHRQGDTGAGAQAEFCNAHTYDGRFESVLEARGARVLYPTYVYDTEEEHACAQVTRRIMQLISVDGLPSTRVFVGGFGLGAELALAVALRLPLDLGGYFALDGWRTLPTIAVDRAPAPKLAVVNPPTHDAVAALRAAGAQVDVYSVAEDPISRQVALAAAWLLDKLPEPRPAVETKELERQPARRGVPFSLESVASAETVAVFEVPAGCEDLLQRFPVTCCGANFDLEPRGPGRVATTFYSPTCVRFARDRLPRASRRPSNTAEVLRFFRCFVCMFVPHAGRAGHRRAPCPPLRRPRSRRRVPRLLMPSARIALVFTKASCFLCCCGGSDDNDLAMGHRLLDEAVGRLVRGARHPALDTALRHSARSSVRLVVPGVGSFLDRGRPN